MHRLLVVFIATSLLIACTHQGAPSRGTPPRRSLGPPWAPLRPDIHLPQELMVVRGQVPHNSTLDAMLREHGVAPDWVGSLITAARATFDPRRLRSLQPFALERTIDGALSLFEYEIDADWFLRVRRDDERDCQDAQRDACLRAEVLPIPKTLQHVAVAGRIDDAT